jgi:uncharacterized protein
LPLFNSNSEKRIIEKVRIADSYFKKMRGLMFEKKSNFDYALVFDVGKESRLKASIHMLFVFFPIDVVYLNSEKKVVDIVHGIKPFSLNYTPKAGARYFIELPEGKAENIRLKDKIEWKN